MKTNSLTFDSFKVGVALAGLCFIAETFPASNCISSPNNSSCSYPNTSNIQSPYVTSHGTMQTVASHLTSLVLDRVEEVEAPFVTTNRPRARGVAAGAHKDSHFWVNAARSNINNKLSSTAYHGHYDTLMVGVDQYTDKKSILGLGLGFETSKTDTFFNNGQQESNGWTVLPYIAYDIGDGAMWDLNVGYHFGKYSLMRHDPLADTLGYSAKPHEKRWSVGMNLSQNCQMDRFLGSTHASLLWLQERIHGYTEVGSDAETPAQTTRLGRFSIGGTAGVGSFSNDQVSPYLLGNFIWDFKQDKVVVAGIQEQPSNDKTAVELGVGVAIDLGGSFSGHLEGKTELARHDIDRRRSANLALRWNI